MKHTNQILENKNTETFDRNMFGIAYSTFIVLLIFTFVVSCVYIGVNSFLSH